MIELITQNWVWFLIALLIGIATGWWIWGHSGADADIGTEPEQIAQADKDVPAPELEPAETNRDELHVDNLEKAEANPVMAATPAPVTAPVSDGKPNIAAAIGDPDNLRQIKGVGPKLNTLLASLGVTRFDQISAWGDNEIAEVDGYLGNFKGRISRDNWVDQADYLAKGDIEGFEAKYGKMLKG